LGFGDKEGDRLIRFAVFLTSMVMTLIAFFSIGSPWLSIAVPLAILVTGAIVAELLHSHLVDRETKRRDLEDRVRNPPD
jgi:hypothetical protein